MSIDERLEALQPRVRQLLEERVRGIEHLEVLMLLCRDPSRSWTSAEAADHLHVGSEYVQTALPDLLAAQLAVPADDRPSAYRFQPPTPDLRQTCLELARLYDEDRIAVIVVIGHIAVGRVRTSAARTFADAFRIKKPRGGDPDA